MRCNEMVTVREPRQFLAFVPSMIIFAMPHSISMIWGFSFEEKKLVENAVRFIFNVKF